MSRIHLALTTLMGASLVGCPSDDDGGTGDYDAGYAAGLAAGRAESSAGVDALAAELEALTARIEAIEGAGYATESWVAGAFTSEAETAELDTRLGAVEADYATTADLAAIDDLLAVVDADPSAQTVTFHDVNVYIQSGSGATDDDFDTTGTLTGLGNLVIGYDEASADGSDEKTGSHNLVVGPLHSYTSYGGVVFGRDNAVTGMHAAVLGGTTNEAAGTFSAVLAGKENLTTGDGSAVVTGAANAVSGGWAAVLGGYENEAGGLRSMVVGGSLNETGSYWHCAILGGLSQACGANLDTVY